MIERQLGIATKAGNIGTFICHPERDGPFPVIILFMDAPGVREELRDMARRLASVGYYVLLPNLYYRSRVEELPTFLGLKGVAVDPIRKMMFELMEGITIGEIMDDTQSLIEFTDQDKAASSGPIGCVGYCMSGQFAVNAAVRFSSRIRAAAALYGSVMVTPAPDSPHLAIGNTDARLYIGCAEIDHYAPPEVIARLQEAARAPGTNTEVEVYPEVGHGFAFPQRPAFDKAAAERHWERLFTLFDAELRQPK